MHNCEVDEELCGADNECSICFAAIKQEESHSLKECGHTFHTECIMKWFRSKQDTCPLCRHPPKLKLKPPDVFHRANILIEKEQRGETCDIFVQLKIVELLEAERLVQMYIQSLQRQKDVFKSHVKPKKEAILKQYKKHKKDFKNISSPLLKELDRIDEAEHTRRRQLSKLIATQRKNKRQALRDIGIHNIA
jgi:hypothetical protein